MRHNNTKMNLPQPACSSGRGSASCKGLKRGLKSQPNRFSPSNMLPRRRYLGLLVALAVLLIPLSVLAASKPNVAIPSLTAPPEGERWFGVIVGGERVGFAHQNIVRSGDGYRIDSEGSVKMRVMGFSREATSKETYLVGPDLTVRSFSAETRIDGSPLLISGERTGKGLVVSTESAGKKKSTTLKSGGIYPPQVLNIYPQLHGGVVGKTYRVPTLDVESVKVKQIKVEVVGEETLPPDTPTVHLKNNLYPMVDNDIWVDLKGNTLKESVRDDLVLTLAEDEKTAKLHLADEAVAKQDLALDFSLVRLEAPIDKPEQLKKLVLQLTGYPAAMPILQGKGQQGTRQPDGSVIFTMPNPAFLQAPGEAPTQADLEPAPRIPSDDASIIAKKDEILAGAKDQATAARLLVQWVAKQIKGTVTDSQSPLETLKKGEGNCQSHARLYTALARAAGIPTRFVSGLVYAPEQGGFLYHSWAESYLNGWTPADPTFGEMPANPTHIKVVEGDSPDDMAALAGLIGNVRAKVLEKQY
jgi:hypothetical protein